MIDTPDGWRRWFRIWRRPATHDVDAELQFHLEERTGDLIRTGTPPDVAAQQAVQEFGNVAGVRARLVAIDTRIAQRYRLRERWEWVGQDLRYVVRSLRRSPAFVLTVSLTLALGLGANAAIFSLLDRLFFQAPPGIAQPDRVHRIYRLDPVSLSRRNHADGGPPSGIDISSVFSHDDVAALTRALPSGATLGGYATNTIKLGRGDEATALNAQYVLHDYFRVLGVRPARGRFFQDDELRIESPTPVVVISDALWHGRFGSSPDIVGQSMDLDYRRYTIVGVAAPEFRGPDNDAVDLWLPMNMMGTERGGAQWYAGGHGAWIRLLASAGDNASTLPLEHAAALVFRQTETPRDSLASARIAPLVDASRGGWDDKEVSIATRLAGVAAIVMLIACANVANLFLARGMKRRREIAVRLAMGVSRRRLVLLLLFESIVVSLIGAVIAIMVAWWGARALRRAVLPANHWVGSGVDLRVLGFTLLLAIATAVLAGLVPALRSSRPALADSLKGSAREGVFTRSRTRTLLLVAQSALSIVLLSGAGLFVRSLRSVETENIGYDADRIVYAQVDADPTHRDRSVEVSQRLPALAAELRRLPGVESTALTAIAPMQGFSWLDLFLPNGDSLPHVAAQGPFTSYVSPDFFATMGLRVLRGRGLNANDRLRDGLAMVVNETMARSYWSGTSAVGECLILKDRTSRCVPVVGVVTDAHFDGIIEKPSMQFYLPLADSGGRWTAGVIAIRAAPGRAPLLAARIRQQLRPEFAGWANVDVHTMTDDMARELQPWRTGASLFTAAGLLALLVAIVGIYSTISYTFSQRTHEIGVRMALGARAGNVAALVVTEGLRVVVVGVAIGVLIALAAGKLVASMLYKTSPRDPVVLVAVSVTLLLIAAGACLIPAWRALQVDPAVALRSD